MIALLALAACFRVSRLGCRHAAAAGVVLAAALSLPAPVRAADLPSLWAERVKSVVAIEYVIETEVARQPSAAMGTVIDAEGTIILPAGAIDPRTPTWQLKDFKVFLPGDATGIAGEYLGQDAFTGWQYLRVAAEVRAKLTPVTTFAAKGEGRRVTLADFVWGIGLRPKDEDFMPYILQSHLALIQALPAHRHRPTGSGRAGTAGV